MGAAGETARGEPVKRRTLETLTAAAVFAAIVLEVVWLGLLAFALWRLRPPW